MTRRAWIGAGLATAALGVAWTAAWWWSANKLAQEIDRWRDQRRAEGIQVDYGVPRLGGFPLRASARLSAPAIAGPTWAWSADWLELQARPWDWKSLRLVTDSGHRLRWTDRGRAREAQLQAVATEVLLGQQRIDARLTQPRFTTAGLELAAETLKAELVGQALKSDVVGLTGLKVPLTGTVEAELRGSIPGGPLAVTVPQWRDAGGTVELKQLALTSGATALTGNATLALDREMRPIGAGTATVTGYLEALDRLQQEGLVRPNQAAMAKVVLAAMAKPGPDGRPTIELPVSAQDGWLSIGPLRLLQLNALAL